MDQKKINQVGGGGRDADRRNGSSTSAGGKFNSKPATATAGVIEFSSSPPLYAVLTSTCVAALLTALLAVFLILYCRRRATATAARSAGGAGDAGGKQLRGPLLDNSATKSRQNFVVGGPKAARRKASEPTLRSPAAPLGGGSGGSQGYEELESATTTVSSVTSSTWEAAGSPAAGPAGGRGPSRRGYTPLPGAVYPSELSSPLSSRGAVLSSSPVAALPSSSSSAAAAAAAAVGARAGAIRLAGFVARRTALLATGRGKAAVAETIIGKTDGLSAERLAGSRAVTLELVSRVAWSSARLPGATGTSSSSPSSSSAAAAATAAGASGRRATVAAVVHEPTAAPYGLPETLCSYQPPNVRYVSLQRSRTADSEDNAAAAAGHCGHVDAEPETVFPPHVCEANLPPIEANDDDISDVEAGDLLLPVKTLKTLFGVVGGVLGIGQRIAGGRPEVDLLGNCNIDRPEVDRVGNGASKQPAESFESTIDRRSKPEVCVYGSGVAPKPEVRRSCEKADEQQSTTKRNLFLDVFQNRGDKVETREHKSTSGARKSPIADAASSKSPAAGIHAARALIGNLLLKTAEAPLGVAAICRRATADMGTTSSNEIVPQEVATSPPASTTQAAAVTSQNNNRIYAATTAVEEKPQRGTQRVVDVSERQAPPPPQTSPAADAASRRQSAQSDSGGARRFGELADALGIGGLVRSVTGSSGSDRGSAGGISPSTAGSLTPAVAGRDEQFWVPPNVLLQKKRAHSLQTTFVYSPVGGALVDSKNGTGTSAKSVPSTSMDSINEIQAITTTATTTNPLERLTESVLSIQYGATSGSTSVSPRPGNGFVGAGGGGGGGGSLLVQQQQQQQQRRRRASMQDALDHTKINASLYDTGTLNNTGSSGGGSNSNSSSMHAQHTHHHYDFASIQEENVGSINFSLSYDPDQSILTVRLIQARDLVPRDFSGTADPFCRLCVLPDRRGQLQSRVHRRTVCPEFEEQFVFDVSPAELGRRALELLVFDYDQFSHDECVGQVVVPLDQVLLPVSGPADNVVVWKGLSPYEKKSEDDCYGDLMFSMAYLASAERLTVSIIKARRLHSSEDGRTATNPFVRVTVTCPPPVTGKPARRKRKKTTTKRQTSSPVWNEALVFGVDRCSLAEARVELTVVSDGLLGNDEPLGETVVGHGTSGDELAHWMDVLSLRNASARWHRLAAPSTVSGSGQRE